MTAPLETGCFGRAPAPACLSCAFAGSGYPLIVLAASGTCGLSAPIPHANDPFVSDSQRLMLPY